MIQIFPVLFIELTFQLYFISFICKQEGLKAVSKADPHCQENADASNLLFFLFFQPKT